MEVQRLLIMQLATPGGLELSAFNVIDVVNKLPSLVAVLGGGTACDLAPADAWEAIRVLCHKLKISTATLTAADLQALTRS